MSGAVLEMSSKVLKVFAGLASGSPGPGDSQHGHLRDRRRDGQNFLGRLFGRQLFADDAGARLIGAIIFAIAIVALNVAGGRDRDMHAGVMVMRLLAVARVVLHLLPHFGSHIGRAGGRAAARLAASAGCAAAFVIGDLLQQVAKLIGVGGFEFVRLKGLFHIDSSR